MSTIIINSNGDGTQAAGTLPGYRQAAPVYLGNGWAPIPVFMKNASDPDPKERKPNPVKDSWQSAGPKTIEGWITAQGDQRLDVGLRMGPQFSRDWIVALDVDPRNGGDLSLEKMRIENGPLPETFVANTKSGGWHFLLKIPTEVGERLKNSANKLGPGLDIKTRGGYINVEPTTDYHWRDCDLEDVKPRDCAEAPDWFINLLLEIENKKIETTPAPPLARGTADNGAGAGHSIETSAYAAKTQSNLCRELRAMPPESGRNNFLNTAAMKMGQFHAGGEIDAREAEAALKAAALDAGLTQKETDATFASGWRKGLTEPRTANGKVSELPPTVDPAPLLAGVKDSGQVARVSRVQFVDVLDTWSDIEPPVEVIEGILEADSLSQIFGKSGDGKTFVAADWARAIAWGQRWYGREVTHGPVFYLNGESPRGLRRRFMAASQTHGKPIPGRLFVSEVAAPLATAEGALAVHQAVEQMIEQHLRGELPVAIFVDTLARNFGGVENDQTDMAAFVQHLDDYLRRPYRAAVVVVHHTGHGDQTRSRGSSVWRAALDAEYKVTLLPNRQGVIELHNTKMKEAEPPADIELQLVTVELETSDGQPLLRRNGEPLTSAALIPSAAPLGAISCASDGKLGANQRKALDAIRELYGDARETLVDSDRDADRAFVLIGDWQAAVGISKQRFAEVKKTLTERGLISVEGDQVKATL